MCFDKQKIAKERNFAITTTMGERLILRHGSVLMLPDRYGVEDGELLPTQKCRNW